MKKWLSLVDALKAVGVPATLAVVAVLALVLLLGGCDLVAETAILAEEILCGSSSSSPVAPPPEPVPLIPDPVTTTPLPQSGHAFEQSACLPAIY